MLSYEPGSSIGHRLDPRSKLAAQIAFAAAAVAYTTPRGLAVLTALTAGILWLTRTPPLRTLWGFRFILPFLLAAPILDGARWGSPWFNVGAAVEPTLAGYRVLLVLLVAAAYVRTTPVRASRAAIAWAVPGRTGRFLGTGVALVFRFLPVLRADVGRIRDAQRARFGTERPVSERIRLLTVAAANRALGRADRLALALRTRCFAWNPTPPPLRFTRLDAPALLVAACLSAATFAAI